MFGYVMIHVASKVKSDREEEEKGCRFVICKNS